MKKIGVTNKSDSISIDISDQVMRKYWMHTLSNMSYKPHYIPKLRAMDILLLLLLLLLLMDSYLILGVHTLIVYFIVEGSTTRTLGCFNMFHEDWGGLCGFLPFPWF